jgi:2-succinyl-5-enolpyruvyl-6-hydroxy-3-cyclohexene-1-carboxylate synthase
VGERVVAEPAAWCRAMAARMTGAGAARTPWLARWQRAEQSAQAAVDTYLRQQPAVTEPGVARSVVAAVPAGGNLVVASSMPVRDVEWYGAPRAGLRVFANRGANGIDGVVSTAVGVALGTAAPTVALVGDVAFLHDTNALLGVARRGLALTIVCIDNDGGGIFSFLPQATQVPAERFECLFGTPHGVDLAGLAAAHGVAVERVGEAAHVGPAVAASAADGGVRVILVRTDRAENVAVHDAIHRAVSALL